MSWLANLSPVLKRHGPSTSSHSRRTSHERHNDVRTRESRPQDHVHSRPSKASGVEARCPRSSKTSPERHTKSRQYESHRDRGYRSVPDSRPCFVRRRSPHEPLLERRVHHSSRKHGCTDSSGHYDKEEKQKSRVCVDEQYYMPREKQHRHKHSSTSQKEHSEFRHRHHTPGQHPRGTKDLDSSPKRTRPELFTIQSASSSAPSEHKVHRTRKSKVDACHRRKHQEYERDAGLDAFVGSVNADGIGMDGRPLKISRDYLNSELRPPDILLDTISECNDEEDRKDDSERAPQSHDVDTQQNEQEPPEASKVKYKYPTRRRSTIRKTGQSDKQNERALEERRKEKWRERKRQLIEVLGRSISLAREQKWEIRESWENRLKEVESLDISNDDFGQSIRENRKEFLSQFKKELDNETRDSPGGETNADKFDGEKKYVEDQLQKIAAEEDLAKFVRKLKESLSHEEGRGQ